MTLDLHPNRHLDRLALDALLGDAVDAAIRPWRTPPSPAAAVADALERSAELLPIADAPFVDKEIEARVLPPLKHTLGFAATAYYAQTAVLDARRFFAAHLRKAAAADAELGRAAAVALAAALNEHKPAGATPSPRRGRSSRRRAASSAAARRAT